MANWIRAAQARAEQAMQGPWVGMFDGDTQHYIACSGLETVAYGGHCATEGSEEDIQFIAAARSDVPRLCTALLEAVEILECVAGNECRREIGGLMSCEEFFDPNPPLSRPWSDACLPCRARRALTRIQADPEVEHG